MNYKFLVFLFLMGVFNLNAQIDNIELPDVDAKVGGLTIPHLDFYVTNTNEVIYNKDTIKVHEIKELLYQPIKYYGITSVYMPKHIHIFADKNVKYSLIDSVKTEISSTDSSKYIIYRSNFIQKNQYNVKGIKHKSPLSFYSFSPPEYLKTKKEIRERDSISKKDYELNPKLPPIRSLNEIPWKPVYSVERAVYGIQQKIIDEALENQIYKCYTVANNNLIENKTNNHIDINKEELKKLLLGLDVIFLRFDIDLTYESYINFIKTLQELKPNFVHNPNHAEVIELSSQIQELHKKFRIKLCN